MRRVLVPATLLMVLGVVTAYAALGSGHSTSTARARPLAALTPLQQRLLSGFARSAVEQRAAAFAPAARAQGASDNRRSQANGCPVDHGSNVRLNQDCLNLTDPDLQGRGQAQNETAIAQDPSDPDRMVASSNDYRRGDANCYTYYSSDGGRNWQDSTPPMGFTRGTAFGGAARQYWQAGGDTSVAFDTEGNAYLACQMFMRGAGATNNPDQSSAFYVFRSTGTGGASWNFPARPVAEHDDVAGAGDTLLDKEYLPVPGPPVRHLDAVRGRRHGVHLRGVLERPRRELQLAQARQRHQRAVHQHAGRPDAAGHVQQQPVLATVHRPRRRALRGLGQLQPDRCAPGRGRRGRR
jgi:hypothetical protein